jgi:hypothetical protein
MDIKKPSSHFGYWSYLGFAILIGPNETQSNFAIAIHGGANTITKTI